RRDQMADPSEQKPGPEPESRRDDQPEDAAEKVAVVDLADAWKDEAENRRDSRVAHGLTSSSAPALRRWSARPARGPCRGSMTGRCRSAGTWQRSRVPSFLLRPAP